MPTSSVSIDLDTLRAREQYHLAEAKRYRETIDTIVRLSKEQKKADKHVAAARTKSKGGGEKQKRGTLIAVGRALVEQEAPMMPDVVAARANVTGQYPTRTAAVMLARLVRQDLARKRSDGSYVAKAKLVKLIEKSSTNGSGASA